MPAVLMLMVEHAPGDSAGLIGQLRALQPADSLGRHDLKDRYRRENLSHDPVAYEPVPFSMNGGDYLRPIP